MGSGGRLGDWQHYPLMPIQMFDDEQWKLKHRDWFHVVGV